LIEAANPDALIADKAFDADPFIATLTQREITPVIPPKANRKTQRLCDFALYRERNLVERFFNKLKHFRAIATRYDKLARNFLAAVQVGFRYRLAQLNTGPNTARAFFDLRLSFP
jgi:putative transposase